MASAYQGYGAGYGSDERKGLGTVLSGRVPQRSYSTNGPPVNVWIGITVLALALFGFGCAIWSFIILPKCRYGEPECYFAVKECTYDGKSCHVAFKNRAIEASSNHGVEALGIAIFAALANLVPALLLFLVTFVQHPETMSSMLETGKLFIAANLVLMLLSIHHIESLTHDCRWWGDFHHGNSDVCHEGFSLYCVATIAMCISNVTLVYQASVATKSVSQGFIRHIGCYDSGDDSL